MALLPPIDLQRWIDEHRHLLKPPVGNKCIVDGEFISLYDYNQEPPVEVVRMEVEDFQYVRDIENSASAPYEVTMFYGQLTLTDYVN